MVQGNFKVGEDIEVVYQAKNAGTGLTIQMDVYDETHIINNSLSAQMSEIGSTGRYFGVYSPDAEGPWTAVMYNISTGKGHAVKTFMVGGHNIDSIGDAVSVLPNISAIELDHDALESAIRGADSDTLKTLSDQMDDIGEPAMVG